MTSMGVAIDETGGFGPTEAGARLIVAVIVRTTLSTFEDELAKQFAANLRGWPPPLHARDLGDLHRMDLSYTRAHHDALECWHDRSTRFPSFARAKGFLGRSAAFGPGKPLFDAARALLREARLTAARAVATSEGRVLVCGEHGARAIASRPHSHWPRMVNATIEAALAEIVARRSASSVDVLVAANGTLPHLFDPATSRVARSLACPVTVGVAHAGDRLALQAADLFAHALAPKAQRTANANAPLRELRDRIRVRFDRDRDDLGCSATTELHDVLRDAVDHRNVSIASYVSALQRYLAPLPPNAFRYGVEGAVEIVSAL